MASLSQRLRRTSYPEKGCIMHRIADDRRAYAAIAAAAAGSGCRFGGGRKNNASAIAATRAATNGTRNRFLKSVAPLCVNTVCIRYGQIEFASNDPRPRMTALNSPCALERTSLGKYSSTKI